LENSLKNGISTFLKRFPENATLFLGKWWIFPKVLFWTHLRLTLLEGLGQSWMDFTQGLIAMSYVDGHMTFAGLQLLIGCRWGKI